MDPETTPATTPDTTPTDAAAEVMASMEQGIAAAGETPATVDPPAPDTPADDQAPQDSPVDPNAPPADPKGTPPGTEPTAEEKAAAAAAAAEAAKAQPDKAVEDEITALGLKEKAAERFRGMASEIKELAPIREQLKAAGITDLAQLPQVLERSARADEMIAMVVDTGATPDQYGASLDYLKLTTMALSGNREAAEKAFALVGTEYAALAKALGKDIPGVSDPLADYPDLLQEVEDEDITRERALEIAGQRNNAKLQERARGQGEQQRQQQQAAEQGRASLVQWDQHMLANDPTYAGKRDTLNDLMVDVRATLPPSKWVEAAKRLVERIPAAAAAPVPTPAPTPAAKPAPGPMRPGPNRANLAPTTDDPLEALEQGIDAASR